MVVICSHECRVRSLRCSWLLYVAHFYAVACELFHKMNIFSWCMSQIRNKKPCGARCLLKAKQVFLYFSQRTEQKLYSFQFVTAYAYKFFVFCFFFSNEESLDAIRKESSRVIISENKWWVYLHFKLGIPFRNQEQNKFNLWKLLGEDKILEIQLKMKLNLVETSTKYEFKILYTPDLIPCLRNLVYNLTRFVATQYSIKLIKLINKRDSIFKEFSTDFTFTEFQIWTKNHFSFIKILNLCVIIHFENRSQRLLQVNQQQSIKLELYYQIA